MRAKIARQPKSKVANEEPIEPPKPLSLEEIQKEIDVYWKAVDNSQNYEQYVEAWAGLDKYNNLKREHFKK